MKLNLGVIDMPYDYGDDPDATTHEVACRLEYDYSLFSSFYSAHQEEIHNELRDEIVNQIANSIQFHAPQADTLILGETNNHFSLFLETKEVENLGIKGVPTYAALDGVNSRLKQHFGPRRPSFIDGGLLMSTFIAWVDMDA